MAQSSSAGSEIPAMLLPREVVHAWTSLARLLWERRKIRPARAIAIAGQLNPQPRGQRHGHSMVRGWRWGHVFMPFYLFQCVSVWLQRLGPRCPAEPWWVAGGPGLRWPPGTGSWLHTSAGLAGRVNNRPVGAGWKFPQPTSQPVRRHLRPGTPWAGIAASRGSILPHPGLPTLKFPSEHPVWVSPNAFTLPKAWVKYITGYCVRLELTIIWNPISNGSLFDLKQLQNWVVWRALGVLR